MDERAIKCALDWLDEGCSLESIGRHQRFRHGVNLSDEQIRALLDGEKVQQVQVDGPIKHAKPPKPVIVCLCGSTRFMEAFQKANLEETLAGRIVLSVGCNTKSDVGLGLSPEVKVMLDELHKRKIDLCDEILVLNVGGYLGESTKSEIDYAKKLGKKIRYLERVEQI